ncbi:MAG: PEP-CTERM sorting domain-containing protein [Acidobacteria bacterium]|nr:PEP-CTERM sorting domain-containing protein [Acidobacteriota bacterium]
MKNFWKRTQRASLGAFGGACLLLATANPAEGSYITANINNGANGVVCGAANGSSPGAPCYGAPNVRPVQISLGNNFGLTDYGTNRLYAETGNQVATEWMVAFTLSGAPTGTPVSLTVNFAYDLAINAGVNSQAEFRMVANNNVLFPFIIRIATNGLGNRCDDIPPPGACQAGFHSGIYSFTDPFGYSVGPNNRIYLSVQGSVFGSGFVDAANTVTVQSVIVPDGITWAYDTGIDGNPLNFQYASGAVPEPASYALLGSGLLLAALFGRRRS